VRTNQGSRLRTPLFLVWPALCLLLTGCGSAPDPLPSAEPGVYRIVSSLPSRGPAAREARLIRQAVDLAVREFGGVKVEHIALDGGGEDGKASHAIEAANAQRAVNDTSTILYLGPWTSEATGWSLPITSKAGLLHVSPAATWPGLTEAGWEPGEPEIYFKGEVRNFVRLAAPDSWQGKIAARVATGERVTGPLLLDDGSSYSKGLAREFAEEWSLLRGTLIGGPVSYSSFISGELPPIPDHTLIFFAPSVPRHAVELVDHLSQYAPLSKVIFSDVAMDAVERLRNPGLTNNNQVRIVYNGTTELSLSGNYMGRIADYAREFGVLPSPSAARVMNVLDDMRVPLARLSASSFRNSSGVRAALRDELLAALRAPTLVTREGNDPTLYGVFLDEQGNNLAAQLSVYALIEGKLNLEQQIGLRR
jgi:hypothetical protein